MTKKQKKGIGGMRAAMEAAGIPADMIEAAECIMGRAPIEEAVGEILLAFAERVNASRNSGGIGPIRCGTDAVIAAAIEKEGR